MLIGLEAKGIKFAKLFSHTLLVGVVTNFILLFVSDLVTVMIGKKVAFEESSMSVFLIVWLLYALRHKSYRYE